MALRLGDPHQLPEAPELRNITLPRTSFPAIFGNLGNCIFASFAPFEMNNFQAGIKI
jgi:hypothetical protein